MTPFATMPGTREEMAGMLSGQGVELGVAAGRYSATLLRNPKVSRLWSIDRWSDHHGLAEYKVAVERLTHVGRSRATPLRMTFDEAVPLFGDGTLDFAYIDGYAHTGQEGGKVLADWWPKLRPGGVFAGHDYHPKFPQTVTAVLHFAVEHGLEIYTTSEPRYPSWICRKPGADQSPKPPPTAYPIADGASVVLVGNGPSLLGQGMGPKIDAYDEVVRFNRFKVRGHEADAGSKTTLWSSYGSSMVPEDDVRPERMILRGDAVPSYEPREVWRMPMALFTRLRAELQSLSKRTGEENERIIPSTGLLTIVWMLEHGTPQVNLAGFDHFSKAASGLHHYWVQRQFKPPVEHDGEAEAALLSPFAAVGKLMYLRR